MLNDQSIDPIRIEDSVAMFAIVVEFFVDSHQGDDDGRDFRIHPQVNLQSSIYRLALALRSGL